MLLRQAKMLDAATAALATTDDSSTSDKETAAAPAPVDLSSLLTVAPPAAPESERTAGAAAASGWRWDAFAAADAVAAARGVALAQRCPVPPASTAAAATSSAAATAAAAAAAARLSPASVSWLGDLAVDPRYEGYPSWKHALSTPAYPGQLVPARANLHEALLVADLGSLAGLNAVNALAQFAASRAPVRPGVVAVTAEDLVAVEDNEDAEQNAKKSTILSHSRNLTSLCHYCIDIFFFFFLFVSNPFAFAALSPAQLIVRAWHVLAAAAPTSSAASSAGAAPPRRAGAANPVFNAGPIVLAADFVSRVLDEALVDGGNQGAGAAVFDRAWTRAGGDASPVTAAAVKRAFRAAAKRAALDSGDAVGADDIDAVWTDLATFRVAAAPLHSSAALDATPAGAAIAPYPLSTAALICSNTTGSVSSSPASTGDAPLGAKPFNSAAHRAQWRSSLSDALATVLVGGLLDRAPPAYAAAAAALVARPQTGIQDASAARGVLAALRPLTVAAAPAAASGLLNGPAGAARAARLTRVSSRLPLLAAAGVTHPWHPTTSPRDTLLIALMPSQQLWTALASGSQALATAPDDGNAFDPRPLARAALKGAAARLNARVTGPSAHEPAAQGADVTETEAAAAAGGYHALQRTCAALGQVAPAAWGALNWRPVSVSDAVTADSSSSSSSSSEAVTVSAVLTVDAGSASSLSTAASVLAALRLALASQSADSDKSGLAALGMASALAVTSNSNNNNNNKNADPAATGMARLAFVTTPAAAGSAAAVVAAALAAAPTPAAAAAVLAAAAPAVAAESATAASVAAALAAPASASAESLLATATAATAATVFAAGSLAPPVAGAATGVTLLVNSRAVAVPALTVTKTKASTLSAAVAAADGAADSADSADSEALVDTVSAGALWSLRADVALLVAHARRYSPVPQLASMLTRTTAGGANAVPFSAASRAADSALSLGCVLATARAAGWTNGAGLGGEGAAQSPLNRRPPAQGAPEDGIPLAQAVPIAEFDARAVIAAHSNEAGEGETKQRPLATVEAYLSVTAQSTQQVAGLLVYLRDALALPTTVVLLPGRRGEGDEAQQSPVKRFYTAALAPFPLFAPRTGARLPPPPATFAALTSAALLTLTVHTPEPWLLSLAEADDDLDNLRLAAAAGASPARAVSPFDGAFLGSVARTALPPALVHAASVALGDRGQGSDRESEGESDREQVIEVDVTATGQLTTRRSDSNSKSDSTATAKLRVSKRVAAAISPATLPPVRARFALSKLIIEGQATEAGPRRAPAAGVQLAAQAPAVAVTAAALSLAPVSADSLAGVSPAAAVVAVARPAVAATIAMENLGYFQLQARPGVFEVTVASNGHDKVFAVEPTVNANGGTGAESVLSLSVPVPSASASAESKSADSTAGAGASASKTASVGVVGSHSARASAQSVAVTSFVSEPQQLRLRRQPGQGFTRIEDVELDWSDASANGVAAVPSSAALYASWASPLMQRTVNNGTIHVFSIASGHLYERFLRIMMLSVFKNTKSKVKFWFIENFLSPQFKEFAPKMAAEYGYEVAFVTYKWPAWLRGQEQKQRLIWGYKILFLDVIFPLDLDKVVFVDADQVVRGDLQVRLLLLGVSFVQF